MRIVVFDTETTGLPKTREPATRGPDNWPHMVSIAWIVIENDQIVKSNYAIIKPKWEIPADSIAIHGITTEKALQDGRELREVMDEFFAEQHDLLVAHNLNFDCNVIVNALIWDLNTPYRSFGKSFCTMEASKPLLGILYANGRGYKPPKLSELYEFVVKLPPRPSQLHNALYDTQLLAEIVIKSTVLRPMMGLPAVGGSHNKNANKKNDPRVLQL